MEALEICATKATRQIERRERADNADGYRRRGRAGGRCGLWKRQGYGDGDGKKAISFSTFLTTE